MANGEEPMKGRQYRCGDELYDRAMASAAANGDDLSEVIRACLKRYSARVERQIARDTNPPPSD